MRLSCLKDVWRREPCQWYVLQWDFTPVRGFNVDVVYRAIDGTRQPLVHPVGAVVFSDSPRHDIRGESDDVMSKCIPVSVHEWTSGGIRGRTSSLQTQTVLVMTGSGILQGRVSLFRRMKTYDPSQGLSAHAAN